MASTTAWVRVFAPSLPMAFLTCVRTVSAESPSAVAASAPEASLASNVRTSSSRAESEEESSDGRTGRLGTPAAGGERADRGFSLESGDYLGVELAAGGTLELGERPRRAKGRPVGPVLGHRAVGVAGGHDRAESGIRSPRSPLG